MAAIAKFFSNDGGIAFSERVIKIQIGDNDPVILPLDSVMSIRVRRPSDDSDGFVRVDTFDGGRYRLFYDDNQYSDAMRFKRSYDALIMDDIDDDIDAPAPQRYQAKIPVGPPAPKSKKHTSKKLKNACLVVITLCIVIIVWVSSLGGDDEPEQAAVTTQTTQETSTSVESIATFIDSIIRDSYEDAGVDFNIKTNGNTITVELAQDGMALGTVLAQSTQDAETLAAWDTVKQSMLELGKNLYESAIRLGGDNIDVIINVLNDTNRENVLLSIMNGAILYDAVASSNFDT